MDHSVNIWKHKVCGEHLHQGDICQFIRCNILIQGHPEQTIKVITIVEGKDSRMVGFVPKSFQGMESVYIHIGRLIVINKIYKDSTNLYKQRLASNKDRVVNEGKM